MQWTTSDGRGRQRVCPAVRCKRLHRMLSTNTEKLERSVRLRGGAGPQLPSPRGTQKEPIVAEEGSFKSGETRARSVEEAGRQTQNSWKVEKILLSFMMLWTRCDQLWFWWAFYFFNLEQSTYWPSMTKKVFKRALWKISFSSNERCKILIVIWVKAVVLCLAEKSSDPQAADDKLRGFASTALINKQVGNINYYCEECVRAHTTHTK